MIIKNVIDDFQSLIFKKCSVFALNIAAVAPYGIPNIRFGKIGMSGKQ